MQEENKNQKGFHQGMKAELKKVIWPTGKQVVKSTFATISFVLLISVILVALNYTFSFLNTKWFDLVLPNESEDQNITISGDISGDIENSGDEISSVITSGENTTIDNSGDENIVTE